MTPTRFRKRSGKLMKQAREAAGISIEQAAEHFDKNYPKMFTRQGRIESFETGKVAADFEEAWVLARLYGVSVEYFVPLDKPLPEIKKPVTRKQAKKRAFVSGIEQEFVKLARKSGIPSTALKKVMEYQLESASERRIRETQERNLNRRAKK